MYPSTCRTGVVLALAAAVLWLGSSGLASAQIQTELSRDGSGQMAVKTPSKIAYPVRMDIRRFGTTRESGLRTLESRTAADAAGSERRKCRPRATAR